MKPKNTERKSSLYVSFILLNEFHPYQEGNMRLIAAALRSPKTVKEIDIIIIPLYPTY